MRNGNSKQIFYVIVVYLIMMAVLGMMAAFTNIP
jgi:hypothetical protein